MTTSLLDTSTFSFLMEEHPRVRAHAAALGPTDDTVMCSIVRGEIRYGLERMPPGKRRREFEAKAAKLFHSIPCEPIPEAAGDIYGRIKRETERQGTPLGENDLWIAATALALGAVLVTTDSDFQRVAGLAVEDWTK